MTGEKIMKSYCSLGSDLRFLWRWRFLQWFSCLWCIVEVIVALKMEVSGFPRTLVMHTRLFCVVARKTTVVLVQSYVRSFVYSVFPLIYSFISVIVIQYIWFLITWQHSTMVVVFISLLLTQGLLDWSIWRKGGSINSLPKYIVNCNGYVKWQCHRHNNHHHIIIIIISSSTFLT